MELQKDVSVIVTANKDIKKISPPFTLEQLQGIVGGLIEVVRLTNDDIMIVNEEGISLNLPINIIATSVYRRYTKIQGYILGDAIITQRKYIN